MEWVETTARTIDEAKETLLDQLGVDHDDAEFEILEEPKPGLFGRTKGQARVRARVQPKTPPSRDDRRRRPAKGRQRNGGGSDAKKSGDAVAPADRAPERAQPARSEAAPAAPAASDAAPAARAEYTSARHDGDGERLDSAVAARESQEFIEGVLSKFGATATVSVTVDEDGDVSADVTGEQLGRLIGPRGGVISAIEELTRTRLQHVAAGGSTPRFRLDIGGYRASRRPNLELLVDDVVERVRSTGRPHVLDVVVAGERKLVHDRIGATAPDLATHSEGEDPDRRVVVTPA